MAYFRADAAAEEAFGRRAMEMLEEMRPKLQEIYTDFDMQLTEEEKHPETLEDAISPYIRLLDSLM